MKKILFFILINFFSIAFAQTVYYVSQYQGDDSNNGLTWNTAYKTIGAAFTAIGSNPGNYHIKVAQGFYMFNGDNSGNFKEIQLSSDQTVLVEGGYSQMGENGNVVQASSYKVVFDTYDASNASAIEIIGGSNVQLSLKNINIANARAGGGNVGNTTNYAAFVSIDDVNTASFTLDNVHVSEFEGSGTLGFGLIRDSENITININNSLIERLNNEEGRGQIFSTEGAVSNLQLEIDSSMFRNIRGSGITAVLFNLTIDCANDQARSSVNINQSEFLNIKKGTAEDQSPAVLWTRNLPSLTIENSKFYGNRGGEAGVINFENSGTLTSRGNLYQDNYGGQRAGVIRVEGAYACAETIDNTILFDNDTFIENLSGTDLLGGRGGALMIADGNVGLGETAKPVSIINSRFSGNFTSQFNAGAVFVNNSELFKVDNSVFCNNRTSDWFTPTEGPDGGAIYASGTGDFEVTKSTFIANTSNDDGGAIASNNRNSTSISDSYFKGNIAQELGGGIWTNNPTTITNSEFEENTSLTQSGGAIYSYNTLTIRRSLFNQNTVPNNGGAIQATNTVDIQNVRFVNNGANVEGGALDLSGTSTITNVVFNANHSSNAGAIHNTGALNVTSSRFISNPATSEGGAIWTDEVLTMDTSYFEGNTAGTNGGAIYMDTRESHFINNTSFKDNNATAQGGAIFATSTTLTSNDADIGVSIENSEFVNNGATEGGALAVEDYPLSLDNVIFDNNSSTSIAGAVLVNLTSSENLNFNLLNSKYLNNSSSQGGAIYLRTRGPGIEYINGNIFYNNKATTQGGALYLQGSSGTSYTRISEINNNTFVGNNVNGDSTLNVDNGGSEIFMPKGSTRYWGRIDQFESNNVQLDPTILKLDSLQLEEVI